MTQAGLAALAQERALIVSLKHRGLCSLPFAASAQRRQRGCALPAFRSRMKAFLVHDHRGPRSADWGSDEEDSLCGPAFH